MKRSFLFSSKCGKKILRDLIFPQNAFMFISPKERQIPKLSYLFDISPKKYRKQNLHSALNCILDFFDTYSAPWTPWDCKKLKNSPHFSFMTKRTNLWEKFSCFIQITSTIGQSQAQNLPIVDFQIERLMHLPPSNFANF